MKIISLVWALVALVVGVVIGYSLSSGDAPTGETQVVASAPKKDALAATKAREASFAVDEVTGEEQLAEMVTEEDVRIAAFQEYLALSQAQPLKAAREALQSTNDLERMMKLSMLLEGASADDLPAIAEIIQEESDGWQRMQQMGMLYYAWGRVDAPSAVAYAETQGGRAAGMGVTAALSSWARVDPSAARFWVEESEDPGRYRRGLLIGWSESDPTGALQYVSAQEGEGSMLDRWSGRQFARNLVNARGVLALDDVAAMSNNETRRELLERIGSELGENDPASAAARLSRIEDADILRSTIPQLAQQWAQDDPVAAIEFVSQYQSDPSIYQHAMAEAIEEWAERDPYSAGNYLNEQPPSPELDRAVAEYSREAARVDPDAAMTYAMSVNDDGMRSQAVQQVARQWNRNAPEAYAKWAADNPEIAPSADSLQDRRGDRRW
ncbi:hypothetical protein [Cerasicoccus maritimus]|uniref:hypothetical protein n=1 Tax=Cerasicoccus maritimus TaxID=490089 RepID=UPI002852D9E5|nr:hypothetical protein [Cerasicoccus maritimus]